VPLQPPVITALLATTFSFLLVAATPDGAKKTEPAGHTATSMPISITPFYESDGPKVSVGDYSEKLANPDPKKIVEICADLKKDKDKLRAEVMYVAAIRLFDAGEKDEAVYWFYTAQYRSRLFRAILDKDKIGGLGSEAFELKEAYNAFDQLAGEQINKYAFSDLKKLQETLAKVKEEGGTLPKFKDLYPKVSFVDEKNWAGESADIAKGLTEMIEYIKTNADSIKEQRKKNGVDDK
jgi:hypothetical protein